MSLLKIIPQLLLTIAILVPHAAQSQGCVDLDGDGYGMNGDRPCRTRRSKKVRPASGLTITSTELKTVSHKNARLEIKFNSLAKASLKFGTNPNNLNRSGPYQGFFFRNTLIQNLTGLKPNTKYYYQITANDRARKQVVSEIFEFSTTDNVTTTTITTSTSTTTSPPTTTSTTSTSTTTTQPQTSMYLTWSDFEKDELRASLPASTYDNWVGTLGATTPPSGAEKFFRLTIEPYGEAGNAAKYQLDSSIKEAWYSYCFMRGSNFTPTDNVKMPGWGSGLGKNGGSFGVAGGNGGGWAGGPKSWSARSGWVRPSAPSPTAKGRWAIYVYHRDSTNFANGAEGLQHHPALPWNTNPNGANFRQYGETFNAPSGSPGQILDDNWHCVQSRIKLNTLDPSAPQDFDNNWTLADLKGLPADGEIEVILDGVKVIDETGFHFTNNPEYHHISFWINFFHGGRDDTSGTYHDIFLSDIQVSTTPLF